MVAVNMEYCRNIRELLRVAGACASHTERGYRYSAIVLHFSRFHPLWNPNLSKESSPMKNNQCLFLLVNFLLFTSLAFAQSDTKSAPKAKTKDHVASQKSR